MDIFDYIKSREDLRELDFVSVYATIVALIEDGYLMTNVDRVQSKSDR